MRNIPLSPPDISELEINEVVEALKSGWIATGPRTKKLEERLADYCHTPKCVCLNSATAAEELNLRVLGIGEGDEVIVPAYTYTASVSAAVHVGAKVVFIDSQPDSVEMDYDKMEAAINEKTKAIIAVDLGGIICDYDRIFKAVENKKSLFTPSGNTELGHRIQRSQNPAIARQSGSACGQRTCAWRHMARQKGRLNCGFYKLFLPCCQEFHDSRGRRFRLENYRRR